MQVEAEYSFFLINDQEPLHVHQLTARNIISMVQFHYALVDQGQH